jgi:hypothetical protein
MVIPMQKPHGLFAQDEEHGVAKIKKLAEAEEDSPKACGDIMVSVKGAKGGEESGA